MQFSWIKRDRSLLLLFSLMKFFFLSITLAFFFVSCSNSVQYSEIKESEPEAVEWTWVSYDSDDLQFSGRISFDNGDFALLSWSASAVTIAFVGTALEAKIRTNGSAYLDRGAGVGVFPLCL